MTHIWGDRLKKLDLGQTISVLANIGVIAGIIFLAIELRQNSEELSAQTRADRLANRQRYSEVILENEGLLASIARAEAREPLSQVDDFRLYYMGRMVLLGWQSTYREVQQGFIDSEAITVDAWMEEFAGRRDVPRMKEAYERYKPNLDADFVRFMEENIISR